MASILKRPLNLVQNPVYPIIHKQATLKFKDARKNNQVDAGRVLLDLEQHPQMGTYTVLVQSRDRNKQHQYGQSSHKTVVNKEFRPPLQDPILDHVSLSRIPVKVAPIMPGMINPGNPETYQARNDGCTTVSRHIIDDIKGDAGWRTNIVMPFEKDLDVYDPKLNSKISTMVSLTSGMTTSWGSNETTPISQLSKVVLNDKLSASVSSGYATRYTTPLYLDHFNDDKNMENKIAAAASSGFTTQYTKDADRFTPDGMYLENEKLNTILESRQNSIYTFNGETQENRLQLEKKTTAGALTAGMNNQVTKLGSNGTPVLDRGIKINDDRINYSASSYKNIPIKKVSTTDHISSNTRLRKAPTGRYYGTMETSVLPHAGIGAEQNTVSRFSGAIKEKK